MLTCWCHGPTRDLLHLRGEAVDELGVDAAHHHDARPGGADLPGVQRDARDHRRHGGVEVGVGEDDLRRLAAQLEVKGRQVARAGLP